MTFIWDPDKDRINQKTHGISFSTAKFVFNDGKDMILFIVKLRIDGRQ